MKYYKDLNFYLLLDYSKCVGHVMSSPGQRRGSCGHAMASFDGHTFCARCCDKGKGEELCVANKDTVDCKLCNSLTPEQRSQLATPSYKIKKEKREAKRSESANPMEV